MSQSHGLGWHDAPANVARLARRRLKRRIITVLIVALSIAALFAFWEFYPRLVFGSTMRPVAFISQIVQPLPTALSSTGVVTP